MSEQIKIYLIAGEPSGDLLGSRLMRALREHGNVSFYGVGGETMQAEGLHSLFDISDLSVMGFFEVLPSVPRILKRIRQTLQDIDRVKPDIVVTIDSWSFNVRIHQGLKKQKCPVPHIHYVAPQVWAWKAKRAKVIHKWIDALMVLLPFEKKCFTTLPVRYVGHPVIEGGADLGRTGAFRQKYSLPKGAMVMTVLLGSRKTEVKALLPVFEKAVMQMQKTHSNLRIVIPTVKTVARMVMKATKKWKIPVIVVHSEVERYDAFAVSSVALAASGTVSLELAMAGVPHVIAYRINPLTAFLARRILKIKYVNLINILANKEIIPELLQEHCKASEIVPKLEQLLGAGGKQQVKMADEMLAQLGRKDTKSPSEKAADFIRGMIE